MNGDINEIISALTIAEQAELMEEENNALTHAPYVIAGMQSCREAFAEASSFLAGHGV